MLQNNWYISSIRNPLNQRGLLRFCIYTHSTACIRFAFRLREFGFGAWNQRSEICHVWHVLESSKYKEIGQHCTTQILRNLLSLFSWLKGLQIHVLKRGLSLSGWAKGIECIPRCGTWTLRCSAEITRADFTTGLVFFWWALRADRMRGYSIWTCTGWTWIGVWYPEE